MLSLLHAGSLGPPLPPDASHEQKMAVILRSPAATWHKQAEGALVAVDVDLAGAPAPPFEASLLPGGTAAGLLHGTGNTAQVGGGPGLLHGGGQVSGKLSTARTALLAVWPGMSVQGGRQRTAGGPHLLSTSMSSGIAALP